MSYIGDYEEDYATLNFKFTTVASDGTPTTLLGSPVVKVYAANETGTEINTGVTLVVDFDGVTGLNNVLIDLSADAFYATGKDYHVVITTGTVDGTSVVGYVVGSFSIENRFMRGTDGANTTVPDAAGVLPTAVEVRQEIDSNSTRLDADMSSRAPSGEYDTQLDANVSTRAPASEYDTEMARITANVATEAKQDIIDTVVDAILVDTNVTIPALIAAIQTVVDLLEDDAFNKKELNVETSEMELYNDAGTTIIKTWALTDKDGNSITIDVGVPVKRGNPA